MPAGKLPVSGAKDAGRALARAVVTGALALLVGGCAVGGGSPPSVEVPEPGASTTATGSGTRATGVPGSVTQPRPATTSGLPIPSPGPSSVPRGTPATREPPGTPSAGVPATRPEEQPLAIEMERAPATGSTEMAPAAMGDRLADPAHVPARSSNTAVNALLAQADGARRAGNLEGAIAAAERALRIAPSDPAVYYELAVLRLRQGDRARAEQLARKGLSYQPDVELRQRLEDLIARLRAG
jgi:hypothetical protein